VRSGRVIASLRGPRSGRPREKGTKQVTVHAFGRANHEEISREFAEFAEPLMRAGALMDSQDASHTPGHGPIAVRSTRRLAGPRGPSARRSACVLFNRLVLFARFR